MTFQPALPVGGTAGWAFLKRTEAAQAARFGRNAEMVRDEAYFRDRIGTIRSAEALVSDRRLLRISLEAFGLEADLNARAFIRKVLEGGTLRADSLANKLADPRYAEFSRAFGFDLAVPRTVISDFADRMVARWKDRRFESAIGAMDNDMRLAMNARRELASIAEGSGSDRAKWFRIMGNLPLRTVVQGAFNLPPSFARIDLDRQVAMLGARAETLLGSPLASQFADPQKVDALIRRFLVSSGGATPRTDPTLLLLQSGGFGSGFLRRL